MCKITFCERGCFSRTEFFVLLGNESDRLFLSEIRGTSPEVCKKIVSLVNMSKYATFPVSDGIDMEETSTLHSEGQSQGARPLFVKNNITHTYCR